MKKVSLAASKIGSGGLWNLDYRCGKRVRRPYIGGHEREECYNTCEYGRDPGEYTTDVSKAVF